jgi:hypothetical protein
MVKKVALIVFFASLLGVSPLSQAADADTTPRNLRPQSVEGLPKPQTLEGEVLRFEGNYYIVKDMSGKQVRLYTDKTTKIDGNLSPGDKIVARTAAIPADAVPYATSINKLGSPRMVEGRVVSINKGYYVIEDVNGKEVRVYADSGTNTDSPLKIGDKVIVHTAQIPDAYADSITKR